MQTRTAIGLTVAFTAGMALVPMSAKATCDQTIYAERAQSAGTGVFVLGRVFSDDPFYYFAFTNNAELKEMIFAAVAARNRLRVVGDAGTCPATGATRDEGNILQLFQQP